MVALNTEFVIVILTKLALSSLFLLQLFCCIFFGYYSSVSAVIIDVSPVWGCVNYHTPTQYFVTDSLFLVTRCNRLCMVALNTKLQVMGIASLGHYHMQYMKTKVIMKVTPPFFCCNFINLCCMYLIAHWC